jgi:hypothetical protein
MLLYKKYYKKSKYSELDAGNQICMKDISSKLSKEY